MEFQVWSNVWILIIVVTAAFLWFMRQRKRKLPPGPRGIPFLGYLPFLGEKPHEELFRLSKVYGNVFGLNLGMTYTIVMTDYNMAKELFKKYSTSDRPPKLFPLLKGGAGFAELNGPEWLEQRRHTIQTLKNLRFGGKNWEKLLQMQICKFLDLISDSQGHPVDVCKSLLENTVHNILSLVTGRTELPAADGQTSTPQDILESGIEGFVDAHTQSGISSTFPKLYKFCLKMGLVEGQKGVNAIEAMNKYVKNYIQGHGAEENSYVHEYMKEVEKNEKANEVKSFTVSNLIGNVQALIIGGSDTIKESLLWLFLAMAANQNVQDKVHEEIDSVLGNDKFVTWEDRQRLPYCHAAILEAQRWRTTAPLNLLHMTNQDVALGDYIIPKGSSIIAMIWAFHMDPKSWKDPEDYRPERFLDAKGSVIKDRNSYAPFSFGKRICPGETIAIIEIFQYFVSTMQKFQVLPPEDGQPPDLSGKLGIVLTPVTRKLRFFNRLNADR